MTGNGYDEDENDEDDDTEDDDVDVHVMLGNIWVLFANLRKIQQDLIK